MTDDPAIHSVEECDTDFINLRLRHCADHWHVAGTWVVAAVDATFLIHRFVYVRSVCVVDNRNVKVVVVFTGDQSHDATVEVAPPIAY